jgi:hypothetical protein
MHKTVDHLPESSQTRSLLKREVIAHLHHDNYYLSNLTKSQHGRGSLRQEQVVAILIPEQFKTQVNQALLPFSLV